MVYNLAEIITSIFGVFFMMRCDVKQRKNLMDVFKKFTSFNIEDVAPEQKCGHYF